VRFSKRGPWKLQRIALHLLLVGRKLAELFIGPIAVLLRLGAGRRCCKVSIMPGRCRATLSGDRVVSCVISCLVVSLAMISTFALADLYAGIALSVVPVEVAVDQ